MSDGQVWTVIGDKPSATASIVACARAASDGSDDITPWLVPMRFHMFLRATAPQWFGTAASIGLRRMMTGGLTDHMRLRTAAIDGLLQQAINEGIDQVVLLGAGLDVRAHRLAWLGQCVVFEVDHPASQAYKRRKVGSATPGCRELRYVSVDFGRESLLERLSEAGLDRSRPAFWVWEGVTMYLPHEATDETMAAIAQLSASGSRLVLTYMLPGDPLTDGHIRFVKRWLRAIDEPLIGTMVPDDVRAMLRRHGFMALADGSNVDWAREMGESGAGWALFFRSERMAVARRK